MVCGNCDHSWCWVCGFSRGPENSHYEFIHLFCSATLGIYQESKTNWQRFWKYLLMFFIIILGPVLAAIALVVAYFYWVCQCTKFLWDWIKVCTHNKWLRSLYIFFGFIGLLALSVVVLGIVAALGSIAMILLYCWLIIQIFGVLIQWCLKSRKIKIRIEKSKS